MTEIRKGDYTLIRNPYVPGGEVYRNGETIGSYFQDKWGVFAVFRYGNCTPIARLKTEVGCIRRLTNGEWDVTELRRLLGAER